MPIQITQALIFLLKTISNLIIFVFILRLLLQWVRMDFYNPVSQFVFRVTNPLVAPLQRVVPRSRLFDVPGAIVLAVVTAAANWMLLSLYGIATAPLEFLYYVIARAIHLGVMIYVISIIIVAVLSWFGQPRHHPIARALSQLTDPLLARFRRFLPPFEGIDFSPLIAILCLIVVRILVPLHPVLQ